MNKRTLVFVGSLLSLLAVTAVRAAPLDASARAVASADAAVTTATVTATTMPAGNAANSSFAAPVSPANNNTATFIKTGYVPRAASPLSDASEAFAARHSLADGADMPTAPGLPPSNTVALLAGLALVGVIAVRRLSS